MLSIKNSYTHRIFKYANLDKISIICAFLFSFSSNIFSQKDSLYDKLLKMKEPTYKFDNFNFSQNVKTVQLSKYGTENTMPVIVLHSDNQLELHFDDLNASVRNYCYTIVHCNADWTASSLFSSEYADGFNENTINDYRFSSNTLIRYIHYQLTFPNFDIKPLVSGNYALIVYLDYNRDSVVFTRRFFVVEPLVGIEAKVRQASLSDLQKCCQEIDFIVHQEGLSILDPYYDVKINVEQNGRTDNCISDLKPKYVKDQEMVYDFETENIFGGGVEFREFDIRNLNYLGINVNQIQTIDSTYHIELVTDEPRSYKKYNYSKDINGNYFIRAQTANDPLLDSEYAWVYFTLKSPFELLSNKVYVFGALTDWNFSPLNQMVYNYEKKMYELKMLLKQGYYNYIYVTTAEKQHANVHDLEGSHYETDNDYTIFVYIRDREQGYERLMGIKTVGLYDKP